MKNILLGAALAAMSAAFAETAAIHTNALIKIGNKTFTRDQLQGKIHRYQEKRHGGIIREAKSAKGTFVLLNAQKTVPFSALTPLEATIDKWLRVRTAFKDGAATVDVGSVKPAIAAACGTVGVAVVQAGDAPMLVTAPEDGWAIVNVDRIASDNPTADTLASRVRKEILRGFAFVTGGAYLTRADPLMRDVKSPKDLDRLQAEQFGLEIVTHVLESSSFYGLKPWNQTTYQKACEEGWAPAPTNEFQKAIWDKVHEMPTEPIKIKPETKKVSK